MFSKSDDMGLTHLAQRDIPIQQDAQPLRQPARLLEPEKEAEVEKQIQELLQKGLIEPASGVWSSPAVLHGLQTIKCSNAPRHLSSSSHRREFRCTSWLPVLTPDAQEKAAFVIRGGL